MSNILNNNSNNIKIKEELINNSLEKEKQLKCLETKIKKRIKSSFEEAKTISEHISSIKHPTKKNVYVKKMYELKPFPPMMSCKISELLFPEDIENSKQSDNSDNYKDFILTKYSEEALQQIKSLPSSSLASGEKIFTLFKSKDINTNYNTSNKLSVQERVLKKKNFEYEREYTYKKSNDYQTFNHYLLFLSKTSNSAFYCPIDKKYHLKKFVQPVHSNLAHSAEDVLLKKKRQQVIIYPSNPVQDEIDDSNRRMAKYGLNYEMKIDKNEFDKKKILIDEYNKGETIFSNKDSETLNTNNNKDNNLDIIEDIKKENIEIEEDDLF